MVHVSLWQCILYASESGWVDSGQGRGGDCGPDSAHQGETGEWHGKYSVTLHGKHSEWNRRQCAFYSKVAYDKEAYFTGQVRSLNFIVHFCQFCSMHMHAYILLDTHTYFDASCMQRCTLSPLLFCFISWVGWAGREVCLFRSATACLFFFPLYFCRSLPAIITQWCRERVWQNCRSTWKPSCLPCLWTCRLSSRLDTMCWTADFTRSFSVKTVNATCSEMSESHCCHLPWQLAVLKADAVEYLKIQTIIVSDCPAYRQSVIELWHCVWNAAAWRFTKKPLVSATSDVRLIVFNCDWRCADWHSPSSTDDWKCADWKSIVFCWLKMCRLAYSVVTCWLKVCRLA